MPAAHETGPNTRGGLAVPRRVALRLLAALGVGSGLIRADAAGNAASVSTVLPGETAGLPVPTRYRQEEEDHMDPVVTHLNPEGMHANPAFSQAVTVEGPHKTIYIGGQNAVNADGQIVGKGDMAAQTEQVFANLEVVLADAGATLHDIVKWTIYVVQGLDFSPGFEVSMRKWGTSAPPPAISVVIVAGLAHPDFLVEIEAVAITRAEQGAG